MLQFFRSFFSSRIGAAIAIAFLVLIALAFASADVANTGGFGGVAGGDRVATVGNERIDTATLGQAAGSALERIRQDDPTMSMQAFVANGGVEDLLDDLIDRLAIAVFGREHGIVASERLIDSEIVKMGAFRGADGNFSEDIFRQVMQQRGISESLLRDDLRQGLIARQVMLPASYGATLPRELARRYATLLTERREGAIAVLPSMLFESDEKPTAEQLSLYYRENRNDFIRPERRVIRYAAFGQDVLEDAPAPTEAEITSRYNADKERYAASERRRISQVIVPTEAAANVMVAEIRGGNSLESAAQEKGLAASNLELLSQQELSRQFSPAVASAAFSVSAGGIAAPARSPLGWHVMRVAEVSRQPARSLADVRDELTEEIAAEKRSAALGEALEQIERRFSSGENLVEVARSLGAEVQQTAPLTADGQIYLKAGEEAPEVLHPLLNTAFEMEVEQPQLAEVRRGETYVLFDVTDIAQSAPAPLNEISENVESAYLLDRASQAARDAAEQVQAKVSKGASLREAMASLDVRVPPVQNVSMTLPELSRMQQQNEGQVPAPLALMFNMAEGTVKVRSAPMNQGWFIVSLQNIEPGEVADDDEIFEAARQELSTAAGREYTEALGRAIRNQIGVERNEAGIRAVREQLGGGA